MNVDIGENVRKAEHVEFTTDAGLVAYGAIGTYFLRIGEAPYILSLPDRFNGCFSAKHDSLFAFWQTSVTTTSSVLNMKKVYPEEGSVNTFVIDFVSPVADSSITTVSVVASIFNEHSGNFWIVLQKNIDYGYGSMYGSMSKNSNTFFVYDDRASFIDSSNTGNLSTITSIHKSGSKVNILGKGVLSSSQLVSSHHSMSWDTVFYYCHTVNTSLSESVSIFNETINIFSYGNRDYADPRFFLEYGGSGGELIDILEKLYLLGSRILILTKTVFRIFQFTPTQKERNFVGYSYIPVPYYRDTVALVYTSSESPVTYTIGAPIDTSKIRKYWLSRFMPDSSLAIFTGKNILSGTDFMDIDTVIFNYPVLSNISNFGDLTGDGISELYGWAGTRVFAYSISSSPMITTTTRGWNFVSCPSALSSTLLNRVYSDSRARLYSYNPETRLYSEETELRKGDGYAIYSSTVNTFVINEDSLFSFSKTIYPGWNLVGSLSVSYPVSLITSFPGIIPLVYKYNPLTRVYDVADSVMPGEAVWVSSIDTVIITIER
jgi:hypothetical protein